ncbi:MAG: VOC family protein [Marinoscillum sp.]
MAQLVTYVYFNGNCKEAMTFYHQCLGGRLEFTTVGDTPMSGDLPKSMKQCVLQSKLQSNHINIMGSDMIGDDGWMQGNNIAMLVNCDSREQITTLYKNLGEGGQPIHPIEPTFYGALFGGLIDRFGNSWLFNYTNK